MKIFFIRHGECKNQKSKNYHSQNTSLTKLGIKQVKMACSYFNLGEINIIYSSPKKRAVQTAEIISKKIKCPMRVLEDVSERFKIDNPQTKEEIEAYNNYLNYDYVSKKFETCKDFVDANHKALKQIIAKHKDKNENVLIVGHSANLYALNSFFYGVPDNKIVWMQCSNCAIVKWEVL